MYGRTGEKYEAPEGLTVNTIDTASAVIRWYPENKATAYTLTLREQILEILLTLFILFIKILLGTVVLRRGWKLLTW